MPCKHQQLLRVEAQPTGPMSRSQSSNLCAIFQDRENRAAEKHCFIPCSFPGQWWAHRQMLKNTQTMFVRGTYSIIYLPKALANFSIVLETGTGNDENVCEGETIHETRHVSDLWQESLALVRMRIFRFRGVYWGRQNRIQWLLSKKKLWNLVFVSKWKGEAFTEGAVYLHCKFKNITKTFFFYSTNETCAWWSEFMIWNSETNLQDTSWPIMNSKS